MLQAASDSIVGKAFCRTVVALAGLDSHSTAQEGLLSLSGTAWGWHGRNRGNNDMEGAVARKFTVRPGRGRLCRTSADGFRISWKRTGVNYRPALSCWR